MKRTLLLIATVLLVTSLAAQPFILKELNGNDITNDTVDVYGLSTDPYLAFEIDVTNNTDVARNVVVRKEHLDIPEGVTVVMCWYSCYSPDTYLTPEPIMVQPNETRTEFVEDLYFPGDTFGTYIAKFVFFDLENTRDSSYVVVKHHIGGVGMEDKSPAKTAYISNAYPNPAASTVNFDITLPENVINSKIQISNLLGTIIKVVDIKPQGNRVSVNVSDLKNGVYFYSLTVNNNATITRKFVVNR
jgi:hypothetical protein